MLQSFNPADLSVEEAADLLAIRCELGVWQEKQAVDTMNNALIGGGVGLGAGLLSSLMSKRKNKQWLRNALLGSLMGAGIGGAGSYIANALPDASGVTSPPEKLKKFIEEHGLQKKPSTIAPGGLWTNPGEGYDTSGLSADAQKTFQQLNAENTQFNSTGIKDDGGGGGSGDGSKNPAPAGPALSPEEQVQQNQVSTLAGGITGAGAGWLYDKAKAKANPGIDAAGRSTKPVQMSEILNMIQSPGAEKTLPKSITTPGPNGQPSLFDTLSRAELVKNKQTQPSTYKPAGPLPGIFSWLNSKRGPKPPAERLTLDVNAAPGVKDVKLSPQQQKILERQTQVRRPVTEPAKPKWTGFGKMTMPILGAGLGLLGSQHSDKLPSMKNMRNLGVR